MAVVQDTNQNFPSFSIVMISLRKSIIDYSSVMQTICLKDKINTPKHLKTRLYLIRIEKDVTFEEKNVNQTCE